MRRRMDVGYLPVLLALAFAAAIVLKGITDMRPEGNGAGSLLQTGPAAPSGLSLSEILELPDCDSLSLDARIMPINSRPEHVAIQVDLENRSELLCRMNSRPSFLLLAGRMMERENFADWEERALVRTPSQAGWVLIPPFGIVRAQLDWFSWCGAAPPGGLFLMVQPEPLFPVPVIGAEEGDQYHTPVCRNVTSTLSATHLR